MALKVLYDDKVALNSNAGIPDINKVKDLDMNNIKSFLLSGWNLIEGVTFTFSSDDSPTFVMTTSVDLTGIVGLGMRIKLTQATTKYFIVTAITSSSITMYGGTDYTLTSASISNVYYSMLKAPFGFPINPDKWTLSLTSTSQNMPNISNYIGKTPYFLTLSIGLWDIFYQISLKGNGNGGTVTMIQTALGFTTTPIPRTYDFKSSNNGYTSNDTCEGIFKGGTIINNTTQQNIYILALYANSWGNTGITANNNDIPTEMSAVCSYL